MALFDMFKKKPAAEAPAAPVAIEAAAGADVVCAPVSGRIVDMPAVPDPVFSCGALGGGCAIWPEGDVVYAPVTGTVTVTMGHAAGIMSDDGIEVLVHVGIDTVNLEGRGFTGFVAKGDSVVAGQPIIKMDRGLIAESGYQDCVVVAVSNTASFKGVELACAEGSQVAAGAAAVRVTR